MLRGHGFDEIVVTLAFMPQAIRNYFGDGESLGVRSITRSRSCRWDGRLGAARGKLDETFLVISGDALCDLDLGALVDRHKEFGAAVTIGLKAVDNPLRFRIVVTDDDGKVERFLEEAVLGPGLLRHDQHGHLCARAGGAEPRSRGRAVPDFSKELLPLLLEMGRPIYGHVMEGAGRTSATSTSTGRRTSTRSTRRCA